MDGETAVHRPVLLRESVDLLDLRPGLTVVDGTVGAAGHSRSFLEKVSPGGFLLGVDRDPQVAELAARELMRAGFTRGEQFEVGVWRFSQLDEALARRHITGVDRLFLDLGVNSLHLDRPERGFSLKREGPLDMRMNPQEPGAPSAADLVNGLPEAELDRIFRQYGEERFARRIAQAIAKARAAEPLRTTARLQEVVAGAIPRRAWPPRMDPATRVFQALRIAVNGELDELDAVLEMLPGLLRPGGRAGIISFHSLEDRRVKEAFRGLARGCVCPPELPVCMCGRQPQYRLVVRRPVTAGEEEVEANPRARSAKLRVVERLENPPDGGGKDG